jgi:hypothetical protein
VKVSATTRTGRTKATGLRHARARTTQRPKRTPSVPRRVSGPVRRARTQPPAQPPSAPRVAERTGAFLRSLPDRPLVDRLVRGRAWIPVLGVMLAGIVFMQVEVLKLGASVGRSIEATSALTARNQLLRANVAALTDQAHIERLAAGMGMIMPAPGSVGFLPARADGNLGQAIANIHAPDPATFLSSQAANGSVATTSIMSSSDGSIAAIIPGSLASSGASGATGQGAGQGIQQQSSPRQVAPAQASAQQAAPSQVSPRRIAPAQAAPQHQVPTQTLSQRGTTGRPQSRQATAGSGAGAVALGGAGGG